MIIYIRQPLRFMQNMMIPAMVSRLKKVPKNQVMVLVVEDNDDVRAYIKDYLSPHYTIIEGKNGKEGLEKANAEIPDLVVSDVMMPEMDGFELTGRLKTDIKTSHIPVILLTAKAGTDNKIEGLETGADDYLTKPFDGKELIARIKNLIKILSTLWERISRELTMQPSSISVPTMEEKFIVEVVNFVEDHISNAELSVEKLSDHMAMSRIHLHRKLKALTDQSASQFIRTIRLKRAKQLLEQKSATVTEIAYQVGFNNISYFRQVFQRAVWSVTIRVRSGVLTMFRHFDGAKRLRNPAQG